MSKTIQTIFSGSPSYCNRKMQELTRRGYTVLKKKVWSDGKLTYTMVLHQVGL